MEDTDAKLDDLLDRPRARAADPERRADVFVVRRAYLDDEA